MTCLMQTVFTDYEGSGYNRSYHYDSEDFRNLEGLDESYLYGFYCATSEENFNDILSVLGYSSLEQYLTEKEYVDGDGNPSIDAWNGLLHGISGRASGPGKGEGQHRRITRREKDGRVPGAPHKRGIYGNVLPLP